MRTKADIELVSDSARICSSLVLIVNPASTGPTWSWRWTRCASARSELQAALANKGGHRVTAIALIDQAIEETNAGIAAGRSD